MTEQISRERERERERESQNTYIHISEARSERAARVRLMSGTVKEALVEAGVVRRHTSWASTDKSRV